MERFPPHEPIRYGFDPANPPSSTVPNGQFTASFDKRLWMFHRSWEPEKDVRATLMIVHGTVDHSGVYEDLAQHLVKQGIAVFAMDCRGWGMSDGESMYISSMETMVADVDALYQHIHSQDKYQNVKARFLLGKSIGGMVTVCTVAEHPNHFTGLIGLSGAYDSDITPSFLLRGILKVLSYVAPKLPLKRMFDEKLIVADEDALQAWRDDPLCSKDKVRVGYTVEALRVLELMKSSLMSEIKIPLLLQCGSEDRVVTVSGHELFAQKSASEDTSVKIYPQGRHNLLQEPSLKEQVTSDIEEWILARSAGAR